MVGGFINEDPLGFGAGDTNLRRYVGNSPTNYTDPSGEIAFIPIIVGGVLLYAAQQAFFPDNAQTPMNVCDNHPTPPDQELKRGLLGLGLGVGPSLVKAAPSLVKGLRGLTPGKNIPEVTFRGDSRSPSEIFNAGFQPKGTSNNLLQYAENNTPSTFVGTSKSPSVAADFATNGGTRDGFVYAVKPRGGIDVNRTLGTKTPFPSEQEIVIPGGIRPSDIRGATSINSNMELGNFSVINPNFRR